MKKFEFSKIMFAGVAVVTLAIVIITVVLMFLTRDLSPLAYLIPSVFGEMGVITGFYSSKAKAENKVKILVSAKREGLDINNITLD